MTVDSPYLVQDGMLFDDGFEFLGGGYHARGSIVDSADPNHKSIDNARRMLEAAVHTGRVHNLPEHSYVYMFPYYHIYVYGHLWDNLQMLAIAEGTGDDLRNKKYLCGLLTSHIGELSEHFRLFGIDTSDAVPVNAGKFPVCRVQGQLLTYDFDYGPSDIKHADFLRRKYILSNNKINLHSLKASPHRKLFLTRPSNRACLNEREAIAFFSDRGYTIVHGTEGLYEHMRLFWNAEEIVGTHGALFKGMLFHDPAWAPRVTEFCPDNRKMDLFKRNYVALFPGALEYRIIFCKADDSHNITLNIDELKDIIK